MQKTVVGVLRGGPSSEYEISLKSGQAVLSHLPEEFGRRDIFVNKDNQWHMDGFETSPAKLHSHIDVVFNAMHGQYGEDGKVQQLFEGLKIPYTGSGPLASSLAMNKILTKEHYNELGLKTPRSIILENFEGESLPEGEGLSLKIFRKMSPPWVVKPASAGSSAGTTIVRLLKDLPAAIRFAREQVNPTGLPSVGSRGESCGIVIVEEFIRGKEATCGVIDNFRGHEHYPLFPVETKKTGSEVSVHCPAISLTPVEKKVLQDLAVRIHKSLGLRHYSDTDFIISPRGVYVLETNTQPALHHEALLPKALHAVGSSYPEFLKHVVNLAIAGI